MGISPDIWGPSAWKMIHLCILSEPENMDLSRLPRYQEFFEILQSILPCEKCRNHMKENLSKLPPITSIKSKEELFYWSVDLHNLVNQITGKKIWDRKEAFSHWTDISKGIRTLQSEPCVKNIWKTIAIVLLILILVVSIFQFIGRREGKELHMKRILQGKR